jgi:ethanolamine utilization protein EutM
MELAVGFIETRGLVAAIEAADAALKAADVKLVSKDRVDAALMTIKITGELSAVTAAVEAGAAAASRVGKLITKHVIARPGEGMDKEFIYTTIDSRKKPAKPAQPEPKPDAPKAEEDVAVTFDETQLASATVENLRRIARKIEGFPLQGREISKANKEELIRHILSVKPNA